MSCFLGEEITDEPERGTSDAVDARRGKASEDFWAEESGEVRVVFQWNSLLD